MPDRNPRRWLILGVLCLSLLVVVVDNMVLNIAIPALIRDLGASTAEIQWIIDAYILVFAGLLLTAGSLSDRYGRRRGLMTGLIVFGGASVLATVARTPEQLIAVRGLMGAGAAFLMPGTLSVLTTVFDEDERKKAIAIWSSVLMLAALGGPTLGGLLLEHFWWGSVFLLNVPIAALGLLAAWLIIPESRGPAGRPDVLGALLSTAGMAGLVWGVINSASHGWAAGRTVAGFAAGFVLLTAFALWERRVAEPMLPLALFRDRNFAGASISIVLLSFSAGGLMLALTQYLQFVLGYGPMRAGLAFIPMLVTTMVFNGIGVLVDKRFGARAAVAAGLLLMAAGFTVLASIDPGDGYGTLVIAFVVMGAGSGVAAPAAVGTLLAALPPERAGVGSAVNDTVQQLGAALSVAVIGSILTSVYATAMPDGATGAARHSIGEALAIAATTADTALATAARAAFVSALSVTSWVGVIGAATAALVAAAMIRPKPSTVPPHTLTSPVPPSPASTTPVPAPSSVSVPSVSAPSVSTPSVSTPPVSTSSSSTRSSSASSAATSSASASSASTSSASTSSADASSATPSEPSTSTATG